jgi:catechol-2,3-dioxygenase
MPHSMAPQSDLRDRPSETATNIVSPFGNTLLDLHGFRDLNSNDAFDERGPGLDHISFGCTSRSDLVEWAARLDELGVVHGDIIDAGYGSALGFRDPDHIALELFAPPALSQQTKRDHPTLLPPGRAVTRSTM